RLRPRHARRARGSGVQQCAAGGHAAHSAGWFRSGGGGYAGRLLRRGGPPCMCATALSTCRCRRARSPSIAEHLMENPRLRFGQLWNMNLGFFGIQFGWALQMANMSAIYEYLGARPDQIPLLWLAAPLTGLVVQPIIGHLSDHT